MYVYTILITLHMPKRRHRTEPRYSPRRIEAIFKQRKALELRLAGKSYAEIAQQLGYTAPRGAWYAVDAALRRTIQEPADAVRALHIERLQALVRAAWQHVERGEPKYILAVLAILDRISRLYGLDAPTKHEVSISDLRARIDELVPQASDEDKEAAVKEVMELLKSSR